MKLEQAALLSTTFFGPVQWYQKLHRHCHVVIDHHETFRKQTYRNRCLIASAQGVQALTVPVVHGSGVKEEEGKDFVYAHSEVCSLLLSDHGNWRHQHWQALTSAYGESPFFEYYEDDVRPFFAQRNWERLVDYNESICRKMCELLDIHPEIGYTTESITAQDFRDVIRPKHPLPDPDFKPREYYQVFSSKHGFLPNLSILDLLFNMGSESIFFL